METTDFEAQGEKRMKKSEQSLRDLWESQNETKGRDSIRILAENLQNLIDDININSQESQQTPSKMNFEKPTQDIL